MPEHKPRHYNKFRPRHRVFGVVFGLGPEHCVLICTLVASPCSQGIDTLSHHPQASKPHYWSVSHHVHACARGTAGATHKYTTVNVVGVRAIVLLRHRLFPAFLACSHVRLIHPSVCTWVDHQGNLSTPPLTPICMHTHRRYVVCLQCRGGSMHVSARHE